MKFIRSQLIDDRTSATEILTIDLPVNPLSHLILTLAAYNVTDEATVAELLAFVNKVTVSHLGKSIINMESEDLAGLNEYLFGVGAFNLQPASADNSQITLNMIIPFGRRLYDPSECFPATKRGELQLTLDLTEITTSADNGKISVAAVELPEATPARYLKAATMRVDAPSSTGALDVELPIGNKIAALLVRMTTWPTTNSHTFGIEDFEILVNNIEEGYVSGNARSVIGEMMLRTNIPSRSIAAQGKPIPANVNWLDFDPHGDGQYLLETAGKSSVKLRANMGVAEAWYLTPVELIEIAGGE